MENEMKELVNLPKALHDKVVLVFKENTTLRKRVKELEGYARHTQECDEMSTFQMRCEKCGYLLKDHDGKFCVVNNNGKITYHESNHFTPDFACTCGLTTLLTARKG